MAKRCGALSVPNQLLHPWTGESVELTTELANQIRHRCSGVTYMRWADHVADVKLASLIKTYVFYKNLAF